MITTLILALGLALIIEGLFPALFPNRWKAYVQKLSQETPATIRTTGIMIILIGCILVWVIK